MLHLVLVDPNGYDVNRREARRTVTPEQRAAVEHELRTTVAQADMDDWAEGHREYRLAAYDVRVTELTA